MRGDGHGRGVMVVDAGGGHRHGVAIDAGGDGRCERWRGHRGR